jgi:glycine cleavage system H protein
MHNLQEFMLTTKSVEYLIAILFMFAFLTFWRVLNSSHRVPVVEAVSESVRAIRGIFVHPNHTWAGVARPDLVDVGMDRFASSVFGSIKEIRLPARGDRIYQGDVVWRVKRADRELAQVSPISGRVVDVNRKILDNPELLNRQAPEESWILRIAPLRLARETRNLLSGEMLARWNQAVKEQLVATLVPNPYPVLQEGGEIKPDLGDDLTPEQWEKVRRDFFNSPLAA